MEEEKEVKEEVKSSKGNKIFIVEIVIIALFLSFGSGFILRDRLGRDSKESNNEVKENNKNENIEDNKDTEGNNENNIENNNGVDNSKVLFDENIIKKDEEKGNISLDDSIITNLMKPFYDGNKPRLGIINSYFDSFHKDGVSKISVADLSNDIKIIMAYGNFGFYKTISEKELIESYKIIFGSDSDYKREDKILLCPGPSLVYSNGMYVEDKDDIGCGGYTMDKDIATLAYALKDDKKIEVYEYFIVFAESDDTIYSGDKVIGKKEKGKDFIVNPDDALLYKYVFEKNNEGLYVFSSVEKVK